MFEEVPRPRRGLAGWSTRRIVLGPFAIGGGVLLATIGGSVAVAATVFTATTIVASDVPPKPLQQPVVVVSSTHAAHPGTPSALAPTTAGSSGSASSGEVATTADPAPSGPLTVAERPSTSSTVQSTATWATPTPASTISTSSPASSGTASATPTGTPSASPSGPAGNAVVYVSGYDQSSQRVLFEFATVDSGAGPGGTDQYTVSSQQQFSASIADDITITSGGQLCPPAGSSCTVAQLIAGAQTGFFANAAIDADAALHSVIELDNASAAPQSSPSSSPSASAGRSGIAQPTASPTR